MKSNHGGVFAALASIPEREAGLQLVVEALRPQVNRIGVFLNGYDRVPGFLRKRNILVARSDKYGDLNDTGKFFFLDEVSERYYATVDDDIYYPADYISSMRRSLDRIGPGAVLGVHGSIFAERANAINSPRILFHFQNTLHQTTPVDVLGTGTTIFDRLSWKPSLDDFKTPGMADIWLAKVATEHGVELYARRRHLRWLREIDDLGLPETSLYSDALNDDSSQVSVLNELSRRRASFSRCIEPLFTRESLISGIGLHQALSLAGYRDRLGYTCTDSATAERLLAVLEAARNRWPQAYDVPIEVVQAYNRLIIQILSGSPQVDDAIQICEFLGSISAQRTSALRNLPSLPAPMNFDSMPQRLERILALIGGDLHPDSHLEAQLAWDAFSSNGGATIELTLRVASLGVETNFEESPILRSLVKQDHENAFKAVNRYGRLPGTSRPLDPERLSASLGEAFLEIEAQLCLGMNALRCGNYSLATEISQALMIRNPWDIDAQVFEQAIRAHRSGTLDERLLMLAEVLDEGLAAVHLSKYSDLLRPGVSDQWLAIFGSTSGSDPDVRRRPRVTVIMTAFNSEETIQAAVRAVLASRGVELDLIVVDDASSDSTLRLVQEIGDPRIRIIANESNVGPYLSRNRALLQCDGDFITFADTDDYNHPERLMLQANYLVADDTLWACRVSHLRITAEGLPMLENHSRFLGDGPPSLLFRRSLIDHIGGFDHVRSRGDIEFTKRIISRFGSGSLVQLSLPLVLATDSPSSNSHRYSTKALQAYRRNWRQWHKEKQGSPELYVPLDGARAPFVLPSELRV